MSLKKKVKKSLDDLCPDTGRGFMESYTGGDDLPELNSYFRQVLVKAPVNTLDERGCLIDEMDPTSWMGYFIGHVAPTVVRFKLTV